MFWMGLIGIYALVLFMIFCGKYVEQFCGKYGNKGKEVFCAFIFTMLTYVLTLFYTYITFVTSNMLVGTFMCAMYLVISWIMTEKVYLIIAGTTPVLSVNDKNFCHLFSVIGVILSSLIMGWDNAEIEYAILISCSVSVLIGAYIPISSIYADKSLNAIWKDITKNFRKIKKSVKITGFICLVFIVITVSSNENAIKIQKVIDAIGAGVVVGTISMSLLLVLVATIKDKRKGK